MKTYTYEHDATTDTWRVIEHETKFDGLSHAEARETAERFAVAAERQAALYRQMEEARTATDSLFRGFA